MTRTNIRGTPSARSAASSRTHGVVSVSSTTSEIDTATRVTTSAAEVQALGGEALRVAVPVHSGSTSRRGVTMDSVAGSTTMPVKTGTNSHTRLMKKPQRQRGGGREQRASRVHGEQHRDVVEERRRDQQHDSADDLGPGVDALQQPALRGDVLAEHDLAQQV